MLQDFIKLKDAVESAHQKADKAEGAIEQLKKQLKEEFGCKTLEEAEEKLKQLTKQSSITKKNFEKAFEDFKEKWKDKLGNL